MDDSQRIEQILNIIQKEMMPAINTLNQNQAVYGERLQRDIDDGKDRGRKIDELTCIVKGNGDGEHPGLTARVSKIEDWINDRVWLERLVIGLIVGQLVAFIWLAMQVINQHLLVK